MSKKVSSFEAAQADRNFAKKDFHSKSVTPRVRVRAANVANAADFLNPISAAAAIFKCHGL